MNKKILITGDEGFTGSAIFRHIINNTDQSVINVDKLSYAGNLETMAMANKYVIAYMSYDHSRALLHVALTGKINETYNIGGHNELQNINVVKTICSILDELVPRKHDGITKYEQLIAYVGDRAGHDARYAIDATKIANGLNWTPDETFATGIKKTVKWYLENTVWCDHVQDVSYQGERLGV